MSLLQIAFILFTFLAPPLLWRMNRVSKSERFEKCVVWFFAGPLLLAFLGDRVGKVREYGWDFSVILPMQLCDWALLAVVLALLFGHPWFFEMAYFWAVSGTLQALFTPATLPDGFWRQFGFFYLHAAIPAGVFWLILARGMRPKPNALWRIIGWTEIYVGFALLSNHLTGGNYGFHSEKPGTGTLLDHFSDERWLYLLQIQAVGVVLFSALYLPWKLLERRSEIAR